MATFGELTTLAHQHLTDLQRTLHTPEAAALAQHPTVRAELSRLTTVLTRYHDRIATGFGIPYGNDHGARDAARRTAPLLRQARQFLGVPADTETPTSELGEKLRSISIALGCGLDLLTSHFPTASDRPPSSDATSIAGPDTARSLIHQLTEYITTASDLTQLTALPAQEATSPLRQAAALNRAFGQQTNTPVAAISLPGAPERIAPRPGEDIDELLAGISTSVQRLKNSESQPSTATWRYLATAAAITSDINHKLILSLTRRLEGLDEHDPASAFNDAAIAADHTSRKWRIVVKNWNQLPGHFGHPADTIATDASDLIIRLGRLVYADPDWRPSPRASYRVKPLEELARTPAQAARTATASLEAIDACNTIAGHRRPASNDAAVIIAIERSNNDPTRQPRRPGHAIHLLSRYKAAETEGHKTAAIIGNAIQSTSRDPSDAIKQLPSRTRQTSTASEDFPTSINACLTQTTKPSPSSPKPHVPSHQTKRSPSV